MNELIVFNNPEFGEVRTFQIDNEVWLVGNDVAKALGYANPYNAVVRHVDEDDTLKQGVTDNLGRTQQTNLINESGMYALVIMSELPSAKKFKRWITKEVIPSIVKTGSYNLPQLTPNQLILQLAQSNVEFEKRLDTIEQKVEQSQEQLDTAIKIFTAPREDNWCEDMDSAIQEFVGENHLSDINFKGRMYKELERLCNVRLESKRVRFQKRLKKQGATYKECQAVTKLHVISNEKALRAVLESIFRKYQALYSASQLRVSDQDE